MTIQFIWDGEQDRPFTLARPCECGCDNRDGDKGVGYLTGSDKDGKGFTLWIEDEQVFRAIQRIAPRVLV